MYELLLVDDEEMSRNSLATYFPWEDYGFHVCGQVSNGKEALDFMEEQIVHVVLTDISMPIMDGVQLAERLREREEEPPCVVFLSAYNDFQYAQNAIRYGVRFYILKPSDFDEIRETFTKIREELDEKFQVEETPAAGYDEDEIISQVLQYIQKEYRFGTLGELAKKIHLNSSYLSQLIKLKTGKNFVDLLFEMRMKQACIFLQDPEVKIYQISSLVGYTNPNNFTRAFKTYYQTSPKEYRLSHSHKGSVGK